MSRHIGKRRPWHRPIALRRRTRTVKTYHYRMRGPEPVAWSTAPGPGGAPELRDITPPGARVVADGPAAAVAAAILADLFGGEPDPGQAIRLARLLSGWGRSWDAPESAIRQFLASGGGAP